MTYRHDLWQIAAGQHAVVTVAHAKEIGVPAVELRKLAQRGALQSCGQGVYVHNGVPTTERTQPAIAVALVGRDSFLHREAVLDLMGLGQFNPRRIRVATQRRVRRALPDWIDLEYRKDFRDDELTHYDGSPTTTIRRALLDVRERIPAERWEELIDQARLRALIDDRDFRLIQSRGELV